MLIYGARELKPEELSCLCTADPCSRWFEIEARRLNLHIVAVNQYRLLELGSNTISLKGRPL